MATDLLATPRERLSRGRYACFVRLQRGEDVLDAEIAEESLGAYLTAFVTIALGKTKAMELPWLNDGQEPITIPDTTAGLLSRVVVEEIRGRDEDESIPTLEYVRLAQMAAEFLSKGECTLCCLGDWTLTARAH